MINADVGYDTDITSVSWTELSVSAIALTIGQRKAQSANKLGIVLDKIFRRVPFRLSVVLGIHYLFYQQGESGVPRHLGTHTTRLLPLGSAILRCLWRPLVRQGKVLCCGAFESSALRSFQHHRPRPQGPTRVHQDLS